MSLSPGTRLGPYEVIAEVGAGGMGIVYRARDTKLGRDVALKVLPDLFADDPERLARFQREARVLASLNHPNIASIYGLEESGPSTGPVLSDARASTGSARAESKGSGQAVRALVLELVEGPTLAERIAQGAIPVEEALPIAKQIADALEAAHEAGVIHRDLKPANVKVKADGMVKVLDFGLAKALDPSPTGDPSESPTMTAAATRMGVIMGTAAYMPPEQAAGKPVDKRGDIWSFGVVLFEMLTGHRLFTGETVSHVLASVLKTEPDWSLLPSDAPTNLLRLLRRCLERDRRNRLHDVADARLELTDLQAIPISQQRDGAAIDRSATGWSVFGVGISALLVGSVVTALALWGLGQSDSSPVTRLVVDAPDLFNTAWGPGVVVSPDGQTLVAGALREDGVTQLYRRSLDRFESQPIPGTEGAMDLFFSPDGQSIGFGHHETLRKVPLSGGEPVILCRVPGGIWGATWGPDDSIIFGHYDGLSQVSADGGEPQSVTTLGPADIQHTNPHFLPDGKAVLFDISRDGEWYVAVRSLETGEQRELGDGSQPHYLPTGHVLFARDTSLWAAPFDVRRLDITAEPRPVLEDVHQLRSTVFSTSQSGVLVFAPLQVVSQRLVRVDHEGHPTPLFSAADRLWYPRVAPDGRSVAVGIDQDIWIIDVETTRRRRLTVNQTSGLFPFSWSPDGTEIVFTGSNRQSFYRIQADGSGQPELVHEIEHPGWPTSWGSDHGTVVFHLNKPDTQRDLWTLDPDNGTSSPFLDTAFQERSASFSPDGGWVAYVSDEADQAEVYVQPYPGPGPKVTVSTDGGTEPVWSADGRQLFYRSGGQMVVVEVAAEPTFAAGQARVLFEDPRYVSDQGGARSNPEYDVFPDGSALVMIEAGALLPRLHVVLNWFEELKALVPID